MATPRACKIVGSPFGKRGNQRHWVRKPLLTIPIRAAHRLRRTAYLMSGCLVCVVRCNDRFGDMAIYCPFEPVPVAT